MTLGCVQSCSSIRALELGGRGRVLGHLRGRHVRSPRPCREGGRLTTRPLVPISAAQRKSMMKTLR